VWGGAVVLPGPVSILAAALAEHDLAFADPGLL
jgi:hypothetical protein